MDSRVNARPRNQRRELPIQVGKLSPARRSYGDCRSPETSGPVPWSVRRPDSGQISFPRRSVTPDYFAVMGIELVQGRMFRASDNAGAPGVPITNQALANRYFAAVNPNGQAMQFAGNPKRPFEIVGIVSDTRTEALSRQADPACARSAALRGAIGRPAVTRRRRGGLRHAGAGHLLVPGHSARLVPISSLRSITSDRQARHQRQRRSPDCAQSVEQGKRPEGHRQRRGQR